MSLDSFGDINLLIMAKKIIIEYWVDTPRGYDNRYFEAETNDEKQALKIAKESPSTRRGKNFKIFRG